MKYCHTYSVLTCKQLTIILFSFNIIIIILKFTYYSLLILFFRTSFKHIKDTKIGQVHEDEIIPAKSTLV